MSAVCDAEEHGLALRFFMDATTGQVNEVQFFPLTGELGCNCDEYKTVDWCPHLDLTANEIDEHGGALPLPNLEIIGEFGEFLDTTDKEQMAQWRQLMLKHSTIEVV